MTKITLKETVADNSQPNVVDFLAQRCDISKTLIKKALIYGACWRVKKGVKRAERCRRAKQLLQNGDQIEFYFDSALLESEPVMPHCLHSERDWGIWYKPANVVSQGSKYGDLHSMERLVAQVSGQNSVFLIHRLDREARGIMVFAYSKKMAGVLSEVWQSGDVKKHYQVEVLGVPSLSTQKITYELDGKPAISEYRVVDSDVKTSLLDVEISTGRYHQIRRHLSMLGHPVMGDPRYGDNNKNTTGMQLVATSVAFVLADKQIACDLPADLRLV